MNLTPFHLAIQVRNIEEARQFYGSKLGFGEGRSTEKWVDFDMFGHQLVVHLNEFIGSTGKIPQITNPVDGHAVPVPHFGVVLEFEQWQEFANKLTGLIDNFIIEPYVRFSGEEGEQGTLFFVDPSGNALEFKGFKDIEAGLFT
ncbi:MAG: glyoxalase [Gammaproteobacteria bacterium]|nr:MAG: glyoxalase [Gammaproteobacteria bacterium]